jgi:hypothetical protein
MSYQAKSNAIAVRKQHLFESLEAGLQEWGVEYKDGQVWEVASDDDNYWSPEKLHPYEVDSISQLDDAQFEKLLEGKSSGARYLARRLRRSHGTFSEILSDWAALKELRHWRYQQDAEYLKKMDLDSAGKLLYLGIRFAWQAEQFCQLYSQVCNTKRPWGSCYQPSHGKVKALALTPNYNRLPMWVKKVLVETPQWIETNEINQGRDDRPEGGRIGDIWRLIDCARAWKWCGSLPKKIAERVGRMSVRHRVLAAIAWQQTWGNYTVADLRERNWEWWEHYRSVNISRSILEARFWDEFRRLEKQSIVTLLPIILEKFNPKMARVVVEILLRLPHECLDEVWSYRRERNHEEYVEIIADYSDPKTACFNLFGCSGKATVQAFQSCTSRNAWKWAAALAFGSPDYAQKYLALSECVPFEQDAIAFLQSLHPSAALRMVGTTTFKVRGEVHAVEPYHVKDTGYLWNQLQPTPPALGRVRCWLSIHEELSHEYIERLPDFDLKVHPAWQKIDGLHEVNGRWEIVIPRKNAQLKLWGKQLDHCVGGYGAAINSGDSIILGVKQGMLTHTLEMIPSGSSFRCRQFYGRGNAPASEWLVDSVLGVLMDAKLNQSRSWHW